MRKTIPTALPAQAETPTSTAYKQEEPDIPVVGLASQTRPAEEETNPRERSLALLRSVADIGNDAEQQETFTTLRTAIDEDRLSNRKRFA